MQGGRRIAIILCCYNRILTTRRCLEQLYSQICRMQEHFFQVYVCDDRSTDGTAEMIEKEFPQVRLMRSGGNLYWCKSMHMGMREAVRKGYDLYIMVNDDVDFFDHALQVMLQSYEKAGGRCGIVGTTKASCGDSCTYGGRDSDESIIPPESKSKECVWANWNCFLADREIVGKVGIIDGKYQHAYGDYDYSYRMRKAGCSIYVADDYIGRCDRNPLEDAYRDKSLKRSVRMKKLLSAKGVPFYSYMRYNIKTQGVAKLPLYLYWYASIIGYIILGKDIA